MDPVTQHAASLVKPHCTRGQARRQHDYAPHVPTTRKHNSANFDNTGQSFGTDGDGGIFKVSLHCKLEPVHGGFGCASDRVSRALACVIVHVNTGTPAFALALSLAL